MKDPSRPEHNFLVADAWAIFVKEIGYVQKGFLSDLPGMNMYVYQRTCARTGFIFYRSRRSSSALEGYHLHLRAAQHLVGWTLQPDEGGRRHHRASEQHHKKHRDSSLRRSRTQSE